MLLRCVTSTCSAEEAPTAVPLDDEGAVLDENEVNNGPAIASSGVTSTCIVDNAELRCSRRC